LSTALFIVLARKIPGIDSSSVAGKFLACHLDWLDEAAKKLVVRPLTELISMNPKEMAAFLEGEGRDTSDLSLPPEQWFDAEEGLRTIEALLRYVESEKPAEQRLLQETAGWCCSMPETRLSAFILPSIFRALINRAVQLPRARFHDRVKSAMNVLLEVGCVAVRVERCLVPVLFVKKEFARILRGLVPHVHQAAGFAARMLLKNAHVLFAFVFRPRLHQHVDFQDEHGFPFTKLKTSR
jgi:hypothetical protein